MSGSQSIYDIDVETIEGAPVSLEEYRNKVLLIVNTASNCGFTPQFGGLQELYEAYHDSGLEVLGFPCNQFMNQDPGNNAEIREFCSRNYGVEFPMFAKLKVNGPDTHPLYRYLKSHARGVLGSERIKWNFTKFLVNPQGQVVNRYPPTAKPDALRQDIEQLLVDR